jgi:ubiquinone/menaquinone biosynthesis C-methylase UbiE
VSQSWRELVDSFYSDEIEQFYENDIGEVLDQSLDPRGPDMLFDLAAELGVVASSKVLDLGSRDGRHLVALRERLGCTPVGVEPADANLRRMRRTYPGETLTVARAIAEALPFADESFDFVWIRDVLVHIESLRPVFAEVRRVLRPGAPVLVFHVFATPLLEPREAERLWTATAVMPTSADPEVFRRAVADAGLQIERWEELRGEWREHLEEIGEGKTSRQLLRVGRMLREPERYKTAIGEREYEVELGDCLYGIYQLLGKLSATVSVLRRP